MSIHLINIGAIGLLTAATAQSCGGVFCEGLNMYEYNYAPIDSSELYLDGVEPEGHVMIVDDILADRSPQRRRKLLLNPALLGAAMKLHLTPSDTVEGRRVWLFECDERLRKIRKPEDFLRMYEGLGCRATFGTRAGRSAAETLRHWLTRRESWLTTDSEAVAAS